MIAMCHIQPAESASLTALLCTVLKSNLRFVPFQYAVDAVQKRAVLKGSILSFIVEQDHTFMLCPLAEGKPEMWSAGSLHANA